MSDNPTDDWLQEFQKDQKSLKGLRPYRPSQTKLHGLGSDLFGLVDFPVKVILLALQELFTNTDKWAFSKDKQKTNIFIMDRWPQTMTGEAERPELRPAVVTDRGPISMGNINGRLHNRRVTPQQGENGLVVFEDLVNCPMTIHCLAPTGLEAERIACLVFGMLVIDENILKRRGIHAILNPEINSEGPLEQTAQLELVNVPVTFGMQYAWAWARRPDGGFVETLEDLVIGTP